MKLSRVLMLLVVGFSAFVLGGGVVSAGPPSGFTPTILSTGTISRLVEVERNGITFKSQPNATVITQQGDFVAGGTSGWHTHPGLTVVTVVSGSVTNTNGCKAPATYVAGQSFVEPPDTPLVVQNASATDSARVITMLIVPAGKAARTNVDAPTCPPPPQG